MVHPTKPDRPRGARSFLALALTLLVLGGCKLIDQTTFAPSPSKSPSLLPATRGLDTRAPLLTVSQGTPIPAYRDLLRFAVQQARARDPNVQFDVLVAVPGGIDPAAQATAVGTTQKEAVALMEEIGRDGVPPTQIHLRAGADTTITQSQIRVYVR